MNSEERKKEIKFNIRLMAAMAEEEKAISGLTKAIKIERDVLQRIVELCTASNGQEDKS